MDCTARIVRPKERGQLGMFEDRKSITNMVVCILTNRPDSLMAVLFHRHVGQRSFAAPCVAQKAVGMIAQAVELLMRVSADKIFEPFPPFL